VSDYLDENRLLAVVYFRFLRDGFRYGKAENHEDGSGK
jgi:hypothetical protein